MKRIYQIPETEIIGITPSMGVCVNDASDGEVELMSNKEGVAFEETEQSTPNLEKPSLWED